MSWQKASVYQIQLLCVCLCEDGRQEECKAKEHGKVWRTYEEETSKARALNKLRVCLKTASIIGEHVRAVRVLDPGGSVIREREIK